jgi:hypothetical protein
MNELAPIFTVPYTRVIPGTQLVKRGVYVYQCPLCRARFRYDDPYEPICTGPSPSRDEHAPEVMRLIGTNRACPNPWPTLSSGV